MLIVRDVERQCCRPEHGRSFSSIVTSNHTVDSTASVYLTILSLEAVQRCDRALECQETEIFLHRAEFSCTHKDTATMHPCAAGERNISSPSERALLRSQLSARI